jgi:hypothetical protein
MSSCVPPIESGYRGSRMKATLEQNSLIINNFCSCNSISNNNPGRTTYVATNLRSYFSPPNPNNATEHQDCNQGHGSNCQRRHSAHDRHARQGSQWADSKAATRFCAQSAQFDPLAYQLISAIQNESHSAQNHKSSPALLHWLIRSPNMSGPPRIRSPNKLGNSCVHRYMDRHPKRNQTIASRLLWRIVIV